MENCKLMSEESNLNIIRNYLLKTVVYKLKKRVIEVRINQNDLYICFLKDVKQFDLQNKIKIRKGYENTSLRYYLIVEDINNLEYAFELAKELYDYLKKHKNLFVNYCLKASLIELWN